jgi:hypothetical protein
MQIDEVHGGLDQSWMTMQLRTHHKMSQKAEKTANEIKWSSAGDEDF